ncbi:hypothetical protein MNB_SV-12-2048 [hydrothermal vent metagenome]|uniref:Uncharacterized protein n=1 Tax=hydrothermal vent metagenome TaxID=652676 RepID=A0A1W1CDJ7_9ZZZZ
MRIHNNINIVNIAIEYGCKTVRDLADFLRVYNPEIIFNDKAKELVYISAFR